MARFTPFRGKLALENADFNRRIDQSGQHVQKFAKDTQRSLDGSNKSAQQLATEIAAMGAVAVGSITLVVNKLKELEADLLLVQYAWTDMGQAGRDAVRLIAQEQAKLTGSAVPDVVKVQTALSNQGIDPRSSGGQALTNVVANFADATGKSHAGVIDSLSPGSIATGASHQRLLDVFAAVGSRTRGGLNAGFDLLGQFLPALAPTGSALGLDESELAALLGTASWHTPRARRAGSGIRMVLEEAVKPDSKFAKAFAETFEMSLEEAVAGRGLTGLIEAFERALTAWGGKGFIGSFGSAETGSLAKAVVGDQQRLREMLQLAQHSAGAAERINEQYERTLKQTAGVLVATFESAQLSLGKLFEEDAIAWMETLTKILDDDNLVKVAGDFLAAATAISGPMRELAVPMASLAASLLAAKIQTPGGEVSAVELLTYGYLGKQAYGLSQASVKGGGKLGGLIGMKQGSGLARAATIGARGAGYVGLGLLANEVLEAVTGFDLLGESMTAFRGALERGIDGVRSAGDSTPTNWQVAAIAGSEGIHVLNDIAAGVSETVDVLTGRGTGSRKVEGVIARRQQWQEDTIRAHVAYIAENLGASVQDVKDYYELLYPRDEQGWRGNPISVLDSRVFHQVVSDMRNVARAAADAARALDDIEPPASTGMGMYQAAQLGMAQLAPAGFSARAALQFAGGVGKHSPMSYMQQQAAADKIAAAFRSDGILSNQERGMLAAIDLHLAELKGLQRRTADATEGTESNTEPQRDYRAQIDIIESADRLLVGG